MAPGALLSRRSSSRTFAVNSLNTAKTAIRNCLFNKNVSARPLRVVVRGERHSYYFKDGTSVYDASCGAGVANLGKFQERVMEAKNKVDRLGLDYVPNYALDTEFTMDLARCLIDSTGGKMGKAIFYCSGTQYYMSVRSYD
jgi:acetylornithine/succinyldiaminopimelate/putrescine aminotransferase